MDEAAQNGPQTPATTGLRRLIIKKMVLENFKSYAGIVEIGPFHKVRFGLVATR